MIRRTIGAVAVLLLATVAHGQAIIVDGNMTEAAAYGAPLFVQTITTQFGDNQDPDPRTAGADPNPLQGGSEMNAIYATVSRGKLHVMITGNLEDNFNKLDILIDSVPGGFNVMPSDPNNNEYPEVDGFCCGAPTDGDGALQRLGGLTFDTGFEADYYLMFTNGNETEKTTGNDNQSWAFTANFSPIEKLTSAGGTLPTDPTPEWGALGGNQDARVVGGTLIDAASADPNTNAFENFYIERDMDNSQVGLQATIDNSNVAGVAGGSGEAADSAAAEAVQTGIEFAIPLRSIGLPPGDIRITAFINNGEHIYLSNQVSGGLPIGTGNLGGDGAGNFTGDVTGIDFASIDGDQFVTVSNQISLGDMDCDGDTDFDDIPDFVVALTDKPAYEAEHLVPPEYKGDMDGNGRFDFDDIPGFVDALSGGSAELQGVPEPTTLLLAVLAGLAVASSQYRKRGRS